MFQRQFQRNTNFMRSPFALQIDTRDTRRSIGDYSSSVVVRPSFVIRGKWTHCIEHSGWLAAVQHRVIRVLFSSLFFGSRLHSKIYFLVDVVKHIASDYWRGVLAYRLTLTRVRDDHVNMLESHTSILYRPTGYGKSYRRFFISLYVSVWLIQRKRSAFGVRPRRRNKRKFIELIGMHIRGTRYPTTIDVHVRRHKTKRSLFSLSRFRFDQKIRPFRPVRSLLF